MTAGLIAVLVLAAFVVLIIAKTAVVVPQHNAYVVERLGKYHATLGAGFHILFPFIDVIRYRHSLKETAVDIPEQVCITRDNVQVHVDGVIYLQVLNAERASYGVSDSLFAISQLAQTTPRSSRSLAPRPTEFAVSPMRSRSPAATRPSNCASPRATSSASVSSRRRRTR